MIRKSSRSRWSWRNAEGEAPRAERCYDRAISRSQWGARRASSEATKKRESDDARREKRPASVPFARLRGPSGAESRFCRFFFTAKAFGNRDAFHLIFLDFCDLICEDYYDIFVRMSWSFWEMITTNKIHGSRKIKKILECQKCTDDIWIDAIWTFTRAFLALSDIRPRTLAISRRTADFCSRDLFAWNKARALAPPFTSREKIEDSSGSIDTLM